MKSLIFTLAIAFTLPVISRPPSNLESLKTNIEKVLSTTGANVNVGIEIVSLKTNEVLYEKNGRNLFVPASLAKIFTVAAALDRLGPEFEFETKVARDSKGNLYLIGAGDPSLKEKALDELAYRVFLQEVKECEDLVVDQSLFDNIVNGPGWMWDEGEYYWNSPIDALLVDHSCIDLWVLPAKTAKTAPLVLLPLSEEPVKIENLAITTVEKGEIDVKKLPATREHTIEVNGQLALSESPKYFRVPVQSPHMYAARLFQKKLKSLGIVCKGEVHIGKTPADAQVLASYHSLPLSVTMRIAMKDSDNLTSNCLFKKLGQHKSGSQGTWANGSKAVRAFLEERVKITKPEDVVLLDGDGESRYNLVSPHHIIQCLQFISGQFAYGPEMIASFPISGCDGRFMKNRLTDVRGKIRAKCGAMTGITGLAGYAETKDGELLAFAIMVNGFTKKAKEMKSTLEDPLCKLLANFSRK